jgi:hypothetical protein
MSVFWKYAVRGHDFQATLDTFYRKQLRDGFISREIREHDGTFQFHPCAPASTGPNVLAFSEWDYFRTFGDRARLGAVFPPLMAYHRWLQRHRTWPDGSYWSCGLASGMDNQPRVQPGDDVWTSHAHSAWVDATAQALLSARCLLRMADALGTGAAGWAGEVAALRAEAGRLEAYMAEKMWCSSQGTFCDRRLGVAAGVRGGAELSGTRTVGAYWALLAGVPLPPERRDAFLRALDDPALFNRPGRVPSLAADHDEYREDGGYWLGGVWPPTSWMVLRGLTGLRTQAADDLAADIAANYHANVAALFAKSGTVFENMSPERGGEPGSPSKPDFVGWGGIGPVAVLLEYVFGLRLDVPAAALVWDVRLTSGFGVHRLPFGKGGLLHVECAPRSALGEPPRLWVRSTLPVTVMVTWGRGASTAGGVENAARAEGAVWRAEVRAEAAWDVGTAEAFAEGSRISALGAPLALGGATLVTAAGDAGGGAASAGEAAQLSSAAKRHSPSGGGGGGALPPETVRAPSPPPAMVSALVDMGFACVNVAPCEPTAHAQSSSPAPPRTRKFSGPRRPARPCRPPVDP